jgi:hypothetical protein
MLTLFRRACHGFARLPDSLLMVPVPFARFRCLRSAACFFPQAGQKAAPSGSGFLHLMHSILSHFPSVLLDA